MKLKDLPFINEPWTDWKNFYKEHVPKFIAEASNGEHYSEWNKDTFYEYFERSAGQCVSSLRQGYFTKVEQDKIKENWIEIAPLLQQISNSQQQPLFEVYNELRRLIRRYTAKDRRAATFRLIAGLQPQSLCTVVNRGKLLELHNFLKDNVENYTFKWTNNWFENSHGILEFYKQELGSSNGYDIMTFPWQTYLYFKNKNSENQSSIEIDMSENPSEETINLLQYKKQIILQGPPGTGKTLLAKELAREFIGSPSEIHIADYFKIGQKIDNASGVTDYYTIEEVTEKHIKLSSDRATKFWNASYNKILEKYDGILNGDNPKSIGNNDPYEIAIAKYLVENVDVNKASKDQLQIVQFHPSYTYEDFVRGIVAKPNPGGEGMLYKVEDKTLATFANKANRNYLNSQKDDSTISIENQLEEAFEAFKDSIYDEIEASKGYLMLTENVGLIDSDDLDAFRYKGQAEGWIKNGNRMLFKDLLQAINDGNTSRQDIKRNPRVSGLAHQHASYFIRMVNRFQEFYTEYKKQNPIQSAPKEQLKKFVLIIDEINRANLSSVLGELIYSLEYRGDGIKSIYEEEGEQELIIPPNLYIIGTMNTADRSVGHIDYAIRRRFAFVDVLPKELNDDDTMVFHRDWFKKVSELFIENYDEYLADQTTILKSAKTLSSEFRPEDVWLGHSYFIQKKDNEENEVLIPNDFNIRIEYEIKPILLEYVKDGVLMGKVNEQRIEDYIKSW